MADEPTKPLNRDKPFKRINNEKFIVKAQERPDGDGVAAGCHIPEDFGEFDKEFVEFLKNRIPAVKTVSDILDTVRKVARAVADAARIAAVIAAVIATAAALGFAAAGPIGSAIAGAAAAVAATTALILGIIDDVLGVIEDVLKTFFGILGRKILPRAIRVIPQWVPVRKGASNAVADTAQVVEVEGICTRSFGNPIDVPFFNWNFWFQWNVQVLPEPEYQNVLSPASGFPTEGLRPIIRDRSFEIHWDAGAIYADRSPFLNGFPATEMPLHDGPMITSEWCWPMAGMFVWASGRWVYDCSRATSGARPQMTAMINPARAVATARFQAHDFKENTTSVPAIQFLFFASRQGGYIDHTAIDDTDYEFIVDLPPIEMPLHPYPIGHTPEFPHNTIVVRPRLLKDVRPLPEAGVAKLEPIVEPIRPEDPTRPPTQVKVKVPGATLKGAGAAGFILSLGWFDPNLEQARNVKICKLTVDGFSGRLQIRDSPAKKLLDVFDKEKNGLRDAIKKRVGDIKILDIPTPFGNIVVHVRDVPVFGALVEDMVAKAFDEFIKGLIKLLPLEKEEWLLRIGVNGLWKTVFFDGVGSSPVELREEKFELVRDRLTFNLHLARGDLLSFATHGTEFDPVGDMMHSPRTNRIITLNGAQVLWREIVNPPPDAKQNRREMVFQYVLKVMTDTTEGVDKMALGFENSPLGLIDPDPSRRGTSPQSNPMVIQNNVKDTPVRRTATFARAVGDPMILVEDPSLRDYIIQYTLEIKDLVAQ